MFRGIFLISSYCVVLGASYYNDLDLTPCGENDGYCITEISNKMLAIIVNGAPDIGVKSADPMQQKYVEGNLALIKYTLTNSTLTGFKTCEIKRARINLKTSILHYELACAKFVMIGDYDANGVLIVVPIEGNGGYRIECRDYKVYVDIDCKFFNGEDGKIYLKFKSFRFDGDLQGGMIMDLQNLFNGQKELGDIVLEFANRNWKPVSKELQEPVFRAYIKTLLKGFNKLLKHIPVDQILLEKV